MKLNQYGWILTYTDTKQQWYEGITQPLTKINLLQVLKEKPDFRIIHHGRTLCIFIHTDWKLSSPYKHFIFQNPAYRRNLPHHIQPEDLTFNLIESVLQRKID